jgi:hypothetical protein
MDRVGKCHPTQAAIHSFAYNALDFLGVKGLIDAVGNLGDKKLSTGEKVAKVVQAAVNVVPIDGEGEGVGERQKIEILPENKIDRNLLNPQLPQGL